MRLTHLRLSGISTALALIFAVSAAPAAASGYIKFGGVEGESTASDHTKQVEILSWSFGTSNASTGSGTHVGGGGAGSGKVDVSGAAPEAAKKKGNVEYGWKVEEGEKAAASHEAEITLKGAAAKPGRVKVGDVTLKRGITAGGSESVGGVKVASGDIDGDGRADLAVVPGQGSGTLTVVVPAGLCQAGARYPTAELGTGSRTYRLTDVIVSSCASAATSSGSPPMESLSISYTEIEWN